MRCKEGYIVAEQRLIDIRILHFKSDIILFTLAIVRSRMYITDLK